MEPDDLGPLTFLFALIGAWLTSLGYNILGGHWMMIVIDVFVFPIGIIHGFLIWFAAVMEFAL